MNYDFFAILDQDVPRCRSWGLGWGSHRRTYLSLTGVGSACYRPDRLERWLAKIKDLKGASIHMEKSPESQRSRRSSPHRDHRRWADSPEGDDKSEYPERSRSCSACQTTESRIAP